MRQKKDEKIAKLDLNDEFLLESADRRFQTGDYTGALRMLNKRNRMYAPTCDSSVLAADIYEALGLYPNAADAWFHFLDTCNEADFAEGYEGLAVAFMNMGNEAQSALYYQKMLAEDEEIPDESKAEIASRMEFLSLLPFSEKPRLRVVYSADGTDGTEAIRRGLEMLRTGKLKEAREALADVSDRSEDYPAAKGLSAMCALLEGDVETAEGECRRLLERYPDNIQALTTYCAVLGEKGDREAAQRVARRLLEIPVTETDDLYKVASALCETGLDEPAFRTLSVLKERLPYDRTVLYFYSVAAYRSGAVEEAISALETLCTVYPRAAVAEYYLTRMRVSRDGGERVETRYFYRMPENEYETVVKFLSKVLEVSESGLERLAAISEPEEFFRLAFDENEGRDEKLQLLAANAAVRMEAFAFLREVLLDYEGNELIKFSILHDLTVRNEDDSFGVVLCNIYKEFFTHKIEIGSRKREEFLAAYADVYSKYALLGEENEKKIATAGEEVYRALENAEAWDCMDEREALAAVIYRESHLRGGRRGIDRIAEMYDAKKPVVQAILDYIL